MDSDYENDYSNSDSEGEYDLCCRESGTCGLPSLPFDPTSLENIILSISDKFNFRILFNDSKVRGAVLVTTGLTLAGTLIGRHYGGKIGAAVGGAVGGACGLGIVGKKLFYYVNLFK